MQLRFDMYSTNAMQVGKAFTELSELCKDLNVSKNEHYSNNKTYYNIYGNFESRDQMDDILDILEEFVDDSDELF